MAGLWDLASALFDIGTQVATSVKNGKIAESDEFKAEVERIKDELEGKSDYEILKAFTEKYCMDGFDSVLYQQRNFQSGLDADSTRIAYTKILSSPRFKTLELACPECEMRLGKRFIPRHNSESYDKVMKDEKLIEGQWHCFKSTCGAYGSWKVEEQNDYMYLSARQY